MVLASDLAVPIFPQSSAGLTNLGAQTILTISWWPHFFWRGNYFPDICPNLKEESEVRLSLSHYHQRSTFQSSDNSRAVKTGPNRACHAPQTLLHIGLSNAWLNWPLKGFEVELSNKPASCGKCQTSRHCASAHRREGQALVFSFSRAKQNRDVVALSIF